MSDPRDLFLRGAFCGMLLMLSAQSIHWFITPAHLEASNLRVAGVAIQALVALGIAAFIYLRARSSFGAKGQASQLT
jgi:hypothetical protein